MDLRDAGSKDMLKELEGRGVIRVSTTSYSFAVMQLELRGELREQAPTYAQKECARRMAEFLLSQGAMEKLPVRTEGDREYHEFRTIVVMPRTY